MVPRNLSFERDSGSEEGKEAAIPPIIAITMTPKITPFLFIFNTMKMS
jgi:hypothetical protein